MNVSLTPKLEALVAKKVASGLYNSASEVIRDALRLFEEREQLREIRLEELRREIALGIEQLQRGEYTEYDESSLATMLERVRSLGRQRLRISRGEFDAGRPPG